MAVPFGMGRIVQSTADAAAARSDPSGGMLDTLKEYSLELEAIILLYCVCSNLSRYLTQANNYK